MAWGRLRTGVLAGFSWLAGCEGPEKVYFEQPSAASGGTVAVAVATGGAPATGGGATETGGSPLAAGVSSSGGETAQSGGAAPTGGTPAAGGAPATGGAGEDPGKQAAACAEYVASQCRVHSECSGARYDQCLLGALQFCPERFFLPGSGLRVEDVERCSEQWRLLDCADVVAMKFPTCRVEGGRRKLGEACRFTSQCEAGRCSVTSEGCGLCLPVVKEGEACGPELALCDVEMACDVESRTCRAPRPGLGVGADCSPPNFCESGLFCAADDAGVRTCRAKIPLGEACGATSECLDGFCGDDTKLCSSVPGLGEVCALEGRHPERSCAGGSVCDAHVEPPVCVTAAGRGEACWMNPKQADGSTCAPGLACRCTDEACAARQCQQLVAPGEDCSFAAFCVEGSECRGGRCGPLTAQPDDTRDCGP